MREKRAVSDKRVDVGSRGSEPCAGCRAGHSSSIFSATTSSRSATTARQETHEDIYDLT
jgi:hypothetical protein